MLNYLQELLRKNQTWIEFQELNREGWLQAWQRTKLQELILKTNPICTAKLGSIEVRILTWRRDWLNAIWALKSFYHFSEIDYPLFIHDGGLKSYQIEQLQYHFPNAQIIISSDADKQVLKNLQQSRLNNCYKYRQSHIFSKKFFDYFILSQAESIISIDSDIIFFRRPNELLAFPENVQNNLFNKDIESYYCMSDIELEAEFGIIPVPNVNAGLSRIASKSMNFEMVNQWLENPKLLRQPWLTEQTLHTLCSTIYGLELLPDTYCVSTNPGIKDDFVCKHYPGFFKTLLYQEGMTYLKQHKFIESLNQSKVNKSQILVN